MSDHQMAAREAPARTELWVPLEDSEVRPEISIVVPALNEEITIGEFVDWCWQGLRQAGVTGEIIIVDSSFDRTPQIALAKGARVLRTPKRGLGQAYIDAIPYIRGAFILMGDCDLTYDFRDIGGFIAAYRSGAEFVMGSRFLGSIQQGAMPALHRYFGTPVTTWILNRIYRSRYSDIHCGMRGITRDALTRIELTSVGWEYASEMVLKAARLKLRFAEVPVKFYKDREGRVSHLRRSGSWWTPWHAGWINLKVMLVYSPDSFLMKPGLAMFILGGSTSIMLAGGGRQLGPIGFDLHWMLLSVTLAVLGFGLFQVGIIARLFHGLRVGLERKVLATLTYDRGMIAAGVLFAGGLLMELAFALRYLRHGLRLEGISYSAIFGLFLIILAAQLFGFTLLLELGRRRGFGRESAAPQGESHVG